MQVWPACRAALLTAAIILGLLEGCPANERRLATPLRPIGTALKITQRWRLFPVANADRFRMWIEARTGADAPWQLLYRPHDDAHTWLADELEYRRMRGAWNPGTRNARGAYPAFVTWVARTTFARDPRWNELRVRMEVLDLDPRRASDPMGATGRFQWEEKRRRPMGSLSRSKPPEIQGEFRHTAHSFGTARYGLEAKRFQQLPDGRVTP